jgi:hypothetical protein
MKISKFRNEIAKWVLTLIRIFQYLYVYKVIYVFQISQFQHFNNFCYSTPT